jgi:lipid A 3-O-deacylase
MTDTIKTITAVLLLCLTPRVASAQSSLARIITVSFGNMDVLKSQKGISVTAEMAFPAVWNELRPVIGLMKTSQKSVYGFAGAEYRVNFLPKLGLILNTAFGIYSRGEGKDLGNVVEFRSGIQLACFPTPNERLTIGLHHLSNAGLSSWNPGTEVLGIHYGVGF